MPEMFNFPPPPNGHEVNVNTTIEDLVRAILVEDTRSDDYLFRISVQTLADSARTTEVMAQHCQPTPEDDARYERCLEDYRRAAAPSLVDMLLGRGPSAMEIEASAHRYANEQAMEAARRRSFAHNPAMQELMAGRGRLATTLATELMRRANAGHARSRQIIRDVLDRTLGPGPSRRRR